MSQFSLCGGQALEAPVKMLIVLFTSQLIFNQVGADETENSFEEWNRKPEHREERDMGRTSSPGIEPCRTFYHHTHCHCLFLAR